MKFNKFYLHLIDSINLKLVIWEDTSILFRRWMSHEDNEEQNPTVNRMLDFVYKECDMKMCVWNWKKKKWFGGLSTLLSSRSDGIISNSLCKIEKEYHHTQTRFKSWIEVWCCNEISLSSWSQIHQWTWKTLVWEKGYIRENDWW